MQEAVRCGATEFIGSSGEYTASHGGQVEEGEGGGHCDWQQLERGQCRGREGHGGRILSIYGSPFWSNHNLARPLQSCGLTDHA